MPGLLVTMLTTSLAILILMLAGGQDSQAIQQAPSSGIEKHWGIQIERLRLTAAGHMLDFRYRVTDVEKAKPLFLRQTKPYLVSQSGAKIGVFSSPKLGPLRHSYEPEAGKVYWTFFPNHNKLKAGDLVTIIIGDFKAENVKVE